MRVVMYLRLSKDDGDFQSTEKPESNSITQQRILLTGFVRNHPDLKYAQLDELCDDGWSGKNFERPGMIELLDQVKCGKVQCIVVKDISRFGRDYLTVGNYISRVFPFMGVRFISVNDNFDSSRPSDVDSLDSSFKTLLYDFYSRDLSRKVKSAMRQRAEHGLFIAPYAPYGYAKDKNNKNQLVIDAPAAEVVRRMFCMALEGCGLNRIATELNSEGILTPQQYKYSMGIQRKWSQINDTNHWTDANVRRILRDERYTGTVIYGKHKAESIGGRCDTLLSRGDWIIRENQHEAIVSREDFDLAQVILNQKATGKGYPRTSSPLSGKIFCGICGHSMYRYVKSHTLYRCKTHFYTDAYSCTEHGVDEDDIIGAIRDSVHRYARLAIRLDEMNKIRNERSKQEKEDVTKQLIALQNEKRRLDSRLQELYEKFVSGALSREKFLSQRAIIAKRQQEISEEVRLFEDSTQSNSMEESEAVAKFIGYAEIDELTRELIRDLVKRIDIYPDNVIDVQLNYTEELEALEYKLRLAGGVPSQHARSIKQA